MTAALSAPLRAQVKGAILGADTLGCLVDAVKRKETVSCSRHVWHTGWTTDLGESNAFGGGGHAGVPGGCGVEEGDSELPKARVARRLDYRSWGESRVRRGRTRWCAWWMR